MPLFRGQRQTRRGGSGSYQDMYGAPSNAGDDMIRDMENMRANSAPASSPTSSGRGRFNMKDGRYILTDPTPGSKGRHDVTVYGDDHKPQYQVSGANFEHDSKTNDVRFFGGKDRGSGQQMSHVWSGQSWGGNLHQDEK